MHVLIADSAARVRSALRLYVEQFRTELAIIEAASLDEVRETLNEVPIDVALVDWHLADGGGVAALRLIRRFRPDACVIVLSGRPEARREASTARADAFVSKSDPPDRLHALLEQAVDSNRVRRPPLSRRGCFMQHLSWRIPLHPPVLRHRGPAMGGEWSG